MSIIKVRETQCRSENETRKIFARQKALSEFAGDRSAAAE